MATWIWAAPAFSEAPSVVASLRVVEHPEGGVDVEWTRAPGPASVLGWHVERQGPSGEAVRLTDGRVEAGLFDPPAFVYRFHDAAAAAHAGNSVSYRLVAVDPELREWPDAFADQTVESAEEVSGAAAVRTPRTTAASVRLAAVPATVGDRVRIVVTNDGLYRLAASDLAAVLQGHDAAQVSQAIAQTNFSLTCGGAAVAWRGEAGGAALVFFGQAHRDVYAAENVYWLEPGAGLAMDVSDSATAEVAADPWYWETAQVEQDLHFQPYLPGGLEDDYFIWDGYKVTSPSTSWQWTTAVPLDQAHPGMKAGQVTAYLSSAYDGSPALDNRTRLFAAGQLLDDRGWAGDERLVQSGAATNLGGASVSVVVELRRETGVTTTMVLIDKLVVRYARRMQARNDQLLFGSEAGAGTLTARGFSGPAIQVFDVADPLRPVAVAATVAPEGAAGWRVSWSAAPAEPGRFLAAAAFMPPARIDGVSAAGWDGARAGAPHVVIAPRALTNAAAALVAHRRQQGLESILVPLEDLYDDFAFGRRDPRAIPRFLAYALDHWSVPPVYVCLAGDGHLDYHDHFGQSATRPNHVPPFLDRIPYDASPSGTMVTLGLDNPLADTDGDGAPDLVIGRLPAQTAAALTKMIARIVAHEASDAWKTKVLLVSDKDENNAFWQATGRLADDVPPEMSVQRLGHTLATPVETMRNSFIQAMNSGSSLAVYYGHANNIGISSPYFFEHSHVRSYMSSLTNSARAPLLLAGTCMLNDFAPPHPDNRCLGKGFLDTAAGGAVAVWASAAEANLTITEALNAAIFDELFATDDGRLGALLRPALDLQSGGASPWTVRSSVLLGDPGTRIRTHRFVPVCTLDPAQTNCPAAGGIGLTLAVSANIGWTAVAHSDWIAIADGSTGLGDGTVAFDVASNDGVVRTGTITVSGEGLVRTFTVHQAGTPPLAGVAAEGDFDGDTLADLSTYHAATGAWEFWYSTGSQTAMPWGWAAALPVPADYDGDGRVDVAVYHPANGTWYVRPSGGGADRAEAFGWSATIPLPGDYDGDGSADLAVFHRPTARWYFRYSSGLPDASVAFGWSAVLPVPADYDGDGVVDLAVYYPATGTWYVHESSSGNVVGSQLGGGKALPVPADYDGDGKADVAVYTRATAQWQISYSGGGSWTKAFGWSGLVPVPADYDGDGAADLAVFHPAARNWYVLLSSTGDTIVRQTGKSGAKPTLLYPLIHSWYRLP